jgi:rod shape-determining protein MreC
LYLPSKIRSNYIAVAALFVFLLLLPFKNTIHYIFTFFARRFIVDPRRVSQEVQELKSKNLALKLQAQQFQDLAQENQALKAALNFKKETKIDLAGVEIISFDPSSWRRAVIIDSGRRNGIREGQYAIDEQGALVGKVQEVGDSYSRLILVGDPDFGLPVFVAKDVLGFLEGGLSQIKILYVEKEETVEVGDPIWLKTASLASVIYIGKVKRVRQETDSLFQDIEVELHSTQPGLRNIFIVR